MVRIDVQIAGTGHLEIEQAVARKEVKHMIQEADPGRNLRLPSAVKIDFNLDIGLARRASFVPNSAHFRLSGLNHRDFSHTARSSTPEKSRSASPRLSSWSGVNTTIRSRVPASREPNRRSI